MGTVVRCRAGVWYLSRAEPLPVHRWSSVMADTADEPRRAALPLGLQTDTDGSNSSAELSSELDQISLRDKSNGVKCRWVGCGLWFSHLDALAVHVTRVHATVGQRGLFYCGWEGCTRGDRGFNARYKMLVHVRTHTNEKPHHCYKCDKSFSRAENLKIHARSHTGERPYACPILGCGKAYSNSSDRFKHTRTHSVDKPYCCKVPGCPKRYTDPSSLRKHVKTYRHFPDIKDEDVTTKIICDEDTSPYKICGFGSPEKEVKTAEESINNEGRTLCTRVWEKDAEVVAGIDSRVSLSTKAVHMGAPMSCDPCRGVPLVAEDAMYGLLHSWLQADLAPHPLPLPWGLSMWTGPWLHERRSDSSPSSDDELVQMQDLPLDLTVHRASTVT